MSNVVSISLRLLPDGDKNVWEIGVVRDDNFQAVHTKDIEAVASHVEALVAFADTVKTEAQKALDEAEKARKKALGFILEKASDEEKVALVDAFDEWAVDATYKAGQYVRHHGVLYACKKRHTSDYELMPPLAQAYWKKVKKEKPSYPIYDHEVTYKVGERVLFGGKPHIYLSLVKQQGQSPFSSPTTWEDEGVAE